MHLRSDILYRPDIDGLRGIAVLLVVAFHSGVRRLSGGFVGVDIFFVISGFLISSIIFRGLDQGNFRFSDFYARRIRRIFPALIIVLLSSWAIGWFVLTSGEYRQMGQHLQGGGFVSNILLWRESGYFDRAAGYKPLLHLWSLGIEEQYYLLWPLTVFLLWKTRIRVLGLILLFLISFGLNLSNIGPHPAATFYQPQTRFWELLIGGIAAYVHSYKKAQVDAVLGRMLFVDSSPNGISALQNIKASLGLLLVVIAVGWINEGTAFPGVWALLPTMGAFLIISAGPEARINRWILANRILVFVGLISYPLYLWHWPLLAFQRLTEIGAPGPWSRFGAVILACLLSCLTYYFVERTFRKRTNIVGQGMGVPVLVSGMLVICGLGALSVYTKGLPARFSDNVRLLATYEDSVHVTGWRADRCYLNPEQDFRSFDSECADLTPGDRPLVFLWGDSHAADIYPGIHSLQSKYFFRLAQYNASGCPPILHYMQISRPYCQEINDWVLARIKDLRPTIVVLASQFWAIDPADTDSGIRQTIKALKAAGIQQIIIVGPTPQWEDQLPKLLFRYFRTGFHRKVPDRIAEGLDVGFFEADRELKEQAATNGVIYLSPTSVLCEHGACLTLVSENGKTDLIAFDEHHLTLTGSQYIASALFAPLFAQMQHAR